MEMNFDDIKNCLIGERIKFEGVDLDTCLVCN